MSSADNRKQERPREGIYSSSRLERTITVVAIAIAAFTRHYGTWRHGRTLDGRVDTVA